MTAHAKHLPIEAEDPVAVARAALTANASNASDGDASPETPDVITREMHRSRRKREIRAKTISIKRMTKRELDLGRLLYPPGENETRPTKRAECQGGQRPCPFVSCGHHLYLDVSPKTGAIKLNFPDLEPHQMGESCALDVADRGGETLEEVGAIMNLTRERIRQVEVKALAKIQALRDMKGLRDYADEGPKGKRRLPVFVALDDDEDAPDPEGVNVGAVGQSITDEFEWGGYIPDTQPPKGDV